MQSLFTGIRKNTLHLCDGHNVLLLLVQLTIRSYILVVVFSTRMVLAGCYYAHRFLSKHIQVAYNCAYARVSHCLTDVDLAVVK